MSFLLSTMVVIATVCGTGMILPQVVRIRRHRIIEGLSPVWIGVGIAMNLWWTAYAIEGALLALLPVSVIGAGLYADLAWRYTALTSRASTAVMAKGGTMLGLVPVPFLVVGGWPAAGLAIGISYGIQFLPAVLTAFKSDHVKGIAPTTWILALIEAVVWFVYGTTTGDPALLVGGGGGTIMASLILFRLATPGNATTFPIRNLRSRIE